MAETTDITLGFVHSKTLADALTDSAIHQGKIYFPTDSTSIVKNGKEYAPVEVVDILDETTESGVVEKLPFFYNAIFRYNGLPVNFIQVNINEEFTSGAEECVVFIVNNTEPNAHTNYFVYGWSNGRFLKKFTEDELPESILYQFGPIVKADRRGLLSPSQYRNIMYCTNGLEYEVANESEEGYTTIPLDIRIGDQVYVELVSGTKDPDASDDFELLGVEDATSYSDESFNQWIDANVNSSEIQISTYTTDKATIRLFIKRKPFTK